MFLSPISPDDGRSPPDDQLGQIEIAAVEGLDAELSLSVTRARR
jgi:hypothetical protein